MTDPKTEVKETGQHRGLFRNNVKICRQAKGLDGDNQLWNMAYDTTINPCSMLNGADRPGLRPGGWLARLEQRKPRQPHLICSLQTFGCFTYSAGFTVVLN